MSLTNRRDFSSEGLFTWPEKALDGPARLVFALGRGQEFCTIPLTQPLWTVTEASVGAETPPKRANSATRHRKTTRGARNPAFPRCTRSPVG